MLHYSRDVPHHTLNRCRHNANSDCDVKATLIAIGRALTGRMPDDIAEEDFRPFTCGLSTFMRKGRKENAAVAVKSWNGSGTPIPKVLWRDGNGVGGGWELKVSGDCSFLSGGEERGW
jgi:transcription factor C subunit 7